MTVFVVGVLLALIVVAGLVFDGGTVIAGHREADAEAAGAARAGAQAIAAASRTSGALSLDAGAGRIAVERYLAPYGHTGTVTIDGDVITVTVRFAEDLQILPIVGLHAEAVTGTASATDVAGGANPA